MHYHGYVIESSTHGVYTGIDWSTTGNSYGPRFAWSIKRTEGEVFYSIGEARKALTRIKAFKDPNWKRPKWIDELYIFNLATAKREQ